MLDAKNRTLRTEIDVPNPKGRLRPGLYANATIVVEEHPDVLSIPTTAVVRESEKDFCVIVENGKAVRRAIQTGLADTLRTEVVSGLTGTESVVAANAASLADGQTVEIAHDPK
jgi:multidrug efflux pump subunit AcrA (membrane-fusion protein)